MSDQDVRLGKLLDDLQHGHLDIAGAVSQVRAMTFSRAPSRPHHQLRHEAALPDLEMPGEDSFFPVSHAYATGRINRRQYEALAAAAASSTV